MRREGKPLPSALRHCAVMLLALWVCAWSFAAQATVVAMVTDLQGKASITLGGRTVNATIAADIEAGAQVQLPPGAILVTLYLASGSEYVFKGPTQVVFTLQQPDVLSGAAPVRRGPAPGNSIRIKPVGMGQGALVMRSPGSAARIRLLSASGTAVLETQPEFRWQEPQPGLKYQVEIADDTGRLLHEAQVEGASFGLPTGLQLKEGMAYTWAISTRLPDGRKYSSIGDFSVAGADLRQQANALRPPASAEFSARVTYAIWLDQIGLKDEARKQWRVLSAERADDDALKQLAER